MRRRLMALLAAAFLAGAPGLAHAGKHALLIGVAEYDNASIRPLTGPRNDVILLWRWLTANGFASSDVRILAEGLPEHESAPRAHAPPTRRHIMDAFDALAERAAAGDLVVVHFSGHGTTQPEVPRATSAAPEAGDRDQVLLPKDAGNYDPALRTIRNAIVDDEIGEALDRIRAKGAIVWAIIDACHAGTVTRSGAVATRGAQPEALGVPAAPALRSGAPAAPPQRSGLVKDAAGKASLIGFFAVDSWTEAVEREFQFTGSFAPGPHGGAPRFGVFTYHLVRALNSGRARTFRDLARIVSLDIASSGSLAQAPLPLFEGDLDLSLAGGETRYARRFAASIEDGKLAIDAGALHGFDVDGEIGLYDGPLDDARRIGAARIRTADAARAVAEFHDEPPAAPASLWAGLESPGVALRYRIAIDARGDLLNARVRDLARRALSGAAEESTIGVELVEGGERDLDVHASDGRLWLAPESRPLDKDPASYTRSVSIGYEGRSDSEIASDLRKALFAFARAANLVRIAAAAELGGGAHEDVQLRVERIHESDSARTRDPRRACGDLAKPAQTDVRSGDTTLLSHCDQVRISLTNRGERDLFVGIFFLTPTGGIALPVAAWRQNGCVAYSPARSTTPLALRTTIRTWTNAGPSHAGLHRVVVFAIPRTQTTAINLCHLLQPDVETARREVVAMRSAGARKGIVRLIDRIAAAEPSLRGANPFEDSPEEASSVLVRQFTFDVRPPTAN